jgi:metacaspase-1
MILVRKMPIGKALTIGLNEVDPERYSGWSGNLNACELDANDMADIARSKGFEVKTLLTCEATRESVKEEMTLMADELESGDIFMISYSGHGGWLPDINGDEEDQNDETWCLYDGEILDDELLVQYAKFAKGVRVIVFSDSCHSGTVTKAALIRSIQHQSVLQTRIKAMPIEKAMEVYLENRELYDEIQRDTSGTEEEDVEASVLLISGCLDHQTSMDGERNGLFTSKLRMVWNDGKFKGNYKTFHKRIKKTMPVNQTPNYYWTDKKDLEFEKQKVLNI